MRMKTVVYLDNSYIATLNELQETIENKFNVREGKTFRKELLAYYKDQVLSNWLEEHGFENESCRLPLWENGDGKPDNELFKEIYRVLLGKECTADLDSAFSQKAMLLRCEVDGKPATIVDGTITVFSIDKHKEIRFVFKAMEEIDSIMAFELVKHNSRKKPLMKKTEKSWYASGGEFSVTFGLALLGDKIEGAYALRCISSKHDEICKIMMIAKKQIGVDCKNGNTIILHHIGGFWITEPDVHIKAGITPVVKYPIPNKVKHIEEILKNLNIETYPYRFRLACPKEIKALFNIGDTKTEKIYPLGREMYYYPINDYGKVWFWDGFSSKTNSPSDVNFMFVAVLDENEV